MANGVPMKRQPADRPRSKETSARSRNGIILKLVSGGQTGVDRAALDAAMECGLPVGGWCPRQRRSEDGAVPTHYPLQETAARSYAVRTEWNVRDSDGTLVVVLDEISSGTRMTVAAARAQGKPLKIEHLEPGGRQGLLSDENSETEQVQSVVDWIHRHKIGVLNVAGPRGSSSPEVYPRAKHFLTLVLKSLCGIDGSRSASRTTVPRRTS
ncbi:MAG: putative molybdenum carrier protein [Planctomycetota bacterium]